MALLNNDLHLTSLGFQQKRNLYYDELKKIELEKRGVIKQLRLFRKL